MLSNITAIIANIIPIVCFTLRFSCKTKKERITVSAGYRLVSGITMDALPPQFSEYIRNI